MKKYFLHCIVGFLFLTTANAGNPDRAGGAGATQLLINPYARSAGLAGTNSAALRGVESFQFNIAGLAYTERTEIVLSTVNYLQGTGIKINNLSFAQSLGTTGGVFGLTVNSWDFGNINVTTEAQPNGTLGTYSPQVLNIGAAYAKKFSNSITGGLSVRYISEGITSMKAQGVALDAGVQYQTALNPKDKLKKEDFRFGISLRNIGPDMVYTGSGLSFKTVVNQTFNTERTTLMGSQSFNLPTLVNIGTAYDMRLDKSADTYFHRLTASGNFNYNAFSSNVLGVGVEYSFKESFMLRTAYSWQEDISNADASKTQYYGITGGCTIQLPISKNGTMLGVDYAYAPTHVFNGVHNVGIRLTIGNKKS